NDAAVRHYGYAKAEFLSMTALDIRPPEEAVRYKERTRDHYAGIHYAGVWKHRKKNGAVIDVDIITHDIIYEGHPVRLVLSNDVTEKIKTQESLRQSYDDLRDLASHLQDVREEERTNIAREIHDELGQQLTGLKMDISWMIRRTKPDEEQLRQKIKSI